MRPHGVLVIIEWISEAFDEATARWCFRHHLRDPGEPGAWLAELNAERAASGLPWEAFFRGWLDHHHLHPAAAIRKELADRFVTAHQSTGPYYFPDVLDADAATEQAAIDAGGIQPGCLRYAGQKSPAGTHRPNVSLCEAQWSAQAGHQVAGTDRDDQDAHQAADQDIGQAVLNPGAGIAAGQAADS